MDATTTLTQGAGHIVNTLVGTNGEGPGSTRSLSLSKYPRSYSRKLTNQIWFPISLTPTIWPANTVLRFILRLPKQMRPLVVVNLNEVVEALLLLQEVERGRMQYVREAYPPSQYPLLYPKSLEYYDIGR